MSRVKEGTRCWVWSRQHASYIPATVANVRGGIATVTSQLGVQRIAVGSLTLKQPNMQRVS